MSRCLAVSRDLARRQYSMSGAALRSMYAVALVLGGLGAPGCGGSADAVVDGRPADAPGTRDASVPDTGTPDASQPDASMPDASTPDAPVPDAGAPATPISNTPNAVVVDVGTPGVPQLELVSSNLKQQRSGGNVFQEWFGEIRNNGVTTLCFVRVDARFQNAAGDELAAFDPFASAAAYARSGLPFALPCIAPGEIGTFYDNKFVAAEISLASVTRIAIALTFNPGAGAFPSPSMPLVASQVGTVPGGLGVIGTLTGRGRAIKGILLEVFPRDDSGLLRDWLIDATSETLFPGAVLPFATLGTQAPFSVYRQYIDFSDADGVAAGLASSTSLRDEPLVALDAARREASAASRARSAQVRTEQARKR